MRPYELPQKKYGLWFEVGQELGTWTQSIVAGALCGDHHIPKNLLAPDEKRMIREMAENRDVLIFID